MKDEKRRQFVDTNILVYAHDASAGEKHIKAKKLITDLWSSQEGCLSIQVLQELYVTLTKKVTYPLKPETTADIIHHLGQWAIHTPYAEDILKAIDIQQQYNLSFWDAMIVCSARSTNCDILWSEDFNSGQIYEGVKVINPFVTKI
jgi:predicted nucleic acid-binding protein